MQYPCEICRGTQILYRGKPLIDHTACKLEMAERDRDRQFIRSLRHELDVRGTNHRDFIARLVSNPDLADE